MDGAFERPYAGDGRPPVPPEPLLLALLLQVFFGVGQVASAYGADAPQVSLSQVCGPGMDGTPWDVTVFTRNRDRLVDAEIAAAFLHALLAHKRVKPPPTS